METIATYWEKQIKIYGTSEKSGLTLIRLHCLAADIARWSCELEKLGSCCSHFVLFSAQAAGSDRMMLNLLMENTEATEYISRMNRAAKTMASSEIETIRPVATVFFHGPHFQERFGIAHTMTEALTPCKINLLFFGCSGTSVYVVVPEQDKETVVSLINTTFVVPGR